jgi:hypothetical protein
MIGTTEATILCIFLAALLIGWSTQTTKVNKTEGATELPAAAFTAADYTNFWAAAARLENDSASNYSDVFHHKVINPGCFSRWPAPARGN